METEEFTVRTLGGDTRQVSRRVIGDTPEHGKHLVWDSHANTLTEINGGLAFALGVAALEAEIARDSSRFWQIQHPNGNVLYHVMWSPEPHITITKVY